MLDKIKAGIIILNSLIFNFLSLYGLNYRSFLSDLTYEKGKKFVKNIGL